MEKQHQINSMVENDLVLIGDGSHARVIKEIINLEKKHKIIAILDEKYKENFYENDILFGNLGNIRYFNKKNYVSFMIAFGDNDLREKVVEDYQLSQHKFAKVIHPFSFVSETAEIGYGSTIGAGVVINPYSNIGNHTIINTGAIIEHDNVIDDYCHISPGVSIAGNVKVSRKTHIGIGSSIIPGISIADNVKVGAGSVVIKDVSKSNCTIVGVPAKPIERKNVNE